MKSIRQINLAHAPNKVGEKVRKIGKILSIISFLLFGLFLILYTASFSLISYLSIKYNSTQERVTELSNLISEKKNVEAVKIASFKKLNSIEKILKSQLPYRLILKDIFEFMPSSIQFKNISVGEDGVVTMETSASSSAALSDFVSLLSTKDELEDKYKNINASSVSRESEGAYNLNVTFVLNKAKFNEN